MRAISAWNGKEKREKNKRVDCQSSLGNRSQDLWPFIPSTALPWWWCWIRYRMNPSPSPCPRSRRSRMWVPLRDPCYREPVKNSSRKRPTYRIEDSAITNLRFIVKCKFSKGVNVVLDGNDRFDFKCVSKYLDWPTRTDRFGQYLANILLSASWVSTRDMKCVWHTVIVIKSLTNGRDFVA